MHDGGCSKGIPPFLFWRLPGSWAKGSKFCRGEPYWICSRSRIQRSCGRRPREHAFGRQARGLGGDLPASGWLRVDAHRSLSRRGFLRLAALSAATPVFDVRLPRGLDFTLQNSPTAQKYLIETMPGGVALFDYNNDGLLDIFLVNGGRITSSMQSPETFDRKNPRYWNRLYRQNKDGSFTDVTEQAGLANV